MFVTHHIKELLRERMCQGYAQSRLRQSVSASMATISDNKNIKKIRENGKSSNHLNGLVITEEKRGPR